MGYKRRFVGGPLGGVEDSVELEDVEEHVAVGDGAVYRRDEILEGGGDVIVYTFDAAFGEQGPQLNPTDEDETTP
jgi:hypothetical protein